MNGLEWVSSGRTRVSTRLLEGDDDGASAEVLLSEVKQRDERFLRAVRKNGLPVRDAQIHYGALHAAADQRRRALRVHRYFPAHLRDKRLQFRRFRLLCTNFFRIERTHLAYFTKEQIKIYIRFARQAVRLAISWAH